MIVVDDGSECCEKERQKDIKKIKVELKGAKRNQVELRK